jgi:hypothetical protein
MEERTRHLVARRVIADARARAIAACEHRIEAARARVFAADDGVVGALMTDLEREWRTLSRPDPDAGLMDLWARIAPSSWIDRKRWRDGRGVRGAGADAQLDVAIALASDADGVEAAEAALAHLRTALAPWGTHIGALARWRVFDHDFDGTEALFAGPLAAARETLSARDGGAVALERAERLAQEVRDAASARLPERDVLARAIGHAAFVDAVWSSAARDAASNPVTPLRDLWACGYALATLDGNGATLEVPPL